MQRAMWKNKTKAKKTVHLSNYFSVFEFYRIQRKTFHKYYTINMKLLFTKKQETFDYIIKNLPRYIDWTIYIIFVKFNLIL